MLVPTIMEPTRLCSMVATPIISRSLALIRLRLESTFQMDLPRKHTILKPRQLVVQPEITYQQLTLGKSFTKCLTSLILLFSVPPPPLPSQLYMNQMNGMLPVNPYMQQQNMQQMPSGGGFMRGFGRGRGRGRFGQYSERVQPNKSTTIEVSCFLKKLNSNTSPLGSSHSTRGQQVGHYSQAFRTVRRNYQHPSQLWWIAGHCVGHVRKASGRPICNEVGKSNFGQSLHSSFVAQASATESSRTSGTRQNWTSKLNTSKFWISPTVLGSCIGDG